MTCLGLLHQERRVLGAAALPRPLLLRLAAAAAAVAAEAAGDDRDEAAVHRPAHDVADRIAPELPTSAPVMIIAVLCSVKPIAAAAQPE